MRIQKLHIENFLRVRSITIVPTGNVVRVHGKNRAGKTSILRAIQAALGGKRLHPAKAVHDGEEEGRVEIDLGDFTVEAVFKPDNRVDLTVRTADGAKVRSPQAVLDGFVGTVTFDALAFVRLSPAAQVELLRKLAGVDFTAIDGERAALYSKRTDVGRDRDKAMAQGAGAPVADPPAEVSLADLTAQLQAVSDAESDQRAAEGDRARRKAEQDAAVRDFERAKKTLALTDAAYSIAVDADLAATKRLSAMGDRVALREKLRTAEADNARARELAAKRARKLEGDALHKQYDAITKEIDGIDGKKRKMVAAAKLPVEGLDFTGAEVTFGGRPLSQASDREQVLISAAIGHSLNPKLAALLIREGAFLDEDGWRALSAWADERDVQVWIEDVGTDGAGVLIEDGMVVEGDPAEAFKKATREMMHPRTVAVAHGELDGPLPSEVNEAEAAMLNDEEQEDG